MRKSDVLMLVVYFALVGMVFASLADPDYDRRRVARLDFQRRAYQRIAEHFGRLGIAVENEYYAAIDEMRTI